MINRGFRRSGIGGIAAVAILTLSSAGQVPSAFAAGLSEEDVPATSVVSGGAEPTPAPPSVSAPVKAPSSYDEGVPATPAPKRRIRSSSHHVSSGAAVREAEVEPAQARLKLLNDTWVLATPSKSGKHVEHVVKDKYVIVTGSTRSFLQVRLKNGQVGFIDPAYVSILTPADNLFQLTHDAAVLEKPNKWAKKLAEVHQGHKVHVVGLALNYMMIKMKSGLTGFIPTSAME